MSFKQPPKFQGSQLNSLRLLVCSLLTCSHVRAISWCHRYKHIEPCKLPYYKQLSIGMFFFSIMEMSWLQGIVRLTLCRSNHVQFNTRIKLRSSSGILTCPCIKRCSHRQGVGLHYIRSTTMHRRIWEQSTRLTRQRLAKIYVWWTTQSIHDKKKFRRIWLKYIVWADIDGFPTAKILIKQF